MFQFLSKYLPSSSSLLLGAVALGALSACIPGELEGEPCGSRGLPRCGEGEYCKFPAEASCGEADRPGACAAIPQVCTKEYAPVCGCDGNTYSNECMAAAAGVSVAQSGACGDSDAGTETDGGSEADAGNEPGAVCGGFAGIPCPKGQYCEFAPEAMCGFADATGTCRTAPDACADIYDPVCGCDGRTYGNACEAARAGVSVAKDGACEGSGGDEGAVCGGLLGAGCAKGLFCDFPVEAMCGAADQTGVCRVTPDACPAVFDPVCGCDDRTYGNFCEAASAGVSVAKEGACEGGGNGEGAVCGGLLGLECQGDLFCDFPVATQCGSGDQQGSCRARPEVCTLELNPVCGCDGKTYSNACAAASAGVSVASRGRCR